MKPVIEMKTSRPWMTDDVNVSVVTCLFSYFLVLSSGSHIPEEVIHHILTHVGLLSFCLSRPQIISYFFLWWLQMDRYVITVPPLKLTGIYIPILPPAVSILRCQLVISEMTNSERCGGCHISSTDQKFTLS